MKRGDVHTIEIDGKKYQAQYLGKGSFSTVYYIPGGKVVTFTTCEDYSKEAVALWIRHPIKHIPHIVRHENTKKKCVYSMPLYMDVQFRTVPYEQQEYLTALYESIKNEIIREVQHKEGGNWHRYFYSRYGADIMWRVVEVAASQQQVPKSLILALELMYQAMSNYGTGICWDFRRSNFGVDEAGNLILRDVMWMCGEE